MADESRNPRDNYEFRKLRTELQDVVAELKAEAQLAREQAAENARTAKRQSRAAAEEGVGRRARTAGRVERASGDVLPREEQAALRAGADDAERLARARERGLRAAQGTAQAAERERLALPPGRQPLLLGPGAGGAVGEPYAPYARPIPGSGGAVPPGGGGRFPPPPAAPPPPPGGGGPRRPDRGYVDDANRATAANQRFSGSLRDTIRNGAAYDDSLRRHGALTTEFFAALARGEVTLSELRFQLGATIAKFAGWTAAATATFGVIGAISQLGKGAIDASAGVNQLQRYINNVDTEKAQQQFVDLAQHFNLPIKDVATAMAQMGQVFHDQDQAFEAVKASLYGVKTGQLSVADSTRFVLAITRGFGLQANQLVGVFDRINQAQNKFGVDIRGTAAGVAKAAGNWKAAGGDVNTLTALITAGSAKTGRSGDEMGTAFQRSAEIIKRATSKNKEELAKYGISTRLPVDEIYKRAFALVQSGKVKGAEITRLATALSTPQLAGRISPILQDPAYYKKVEDTLAKSRGSAERELQKLKQSAREQLSAIGVNLQTLGAEFVRAGGGAPFGALLHALNLALRTSTDLLQVFNDLPKPLREAAIIGLELAALAKIAGRFGVSFPRGGSVESRRNATREVDFTRDQARRANEALAEAHYNRDYYSHAERTAPTDELRSAARIRREEAERNVAAAEQRLAYAENRLAEATAAREATMRGAPPGGGVRGPGGVPLAYAPGGGRRAPAPGEPGSPGIPRTTPLGVNLLPDAARAEREAGRFRTAMGRVGGATKGIFTTFGGLTAIASSGMSRLGGLTGVLKGFGGLLRGLLSDPLGAGFLAFTVGTALKDHFNKQGAHYDKIGAGPRSAAERDKILNYRGDNEHDIHAQQVEQDILGQQQAERRANKPVTSLFTSEIRHQSGQTMDALKAHKITRDEAYKQLDVLFTELKSSRSSPALIALAHHDIKKLQQSIGPNSHQSLAQLLKGLDTKDFIAQMQADATVVTDYARRPQRLKEINVGYRIALEAVKKNPTAENVKKFKAAADAVDAVIADSQRRLEDALASAATLGDRERAYDANAARLAKLPHSRATARAQQQNEIARFNDELQSQQALHALRESAIRDPYARAQKHLSDVNADIRTMRDAVRRGVAKQEDLWKLLAERNQTLDEVAAAAEATFQSKQGLAASQFALRVGGAQGPTLRYAVTQAQQAVANARKSGDPNKLRDALKGLADAQLAVQQYIRDQTAAMIQANEAYATAGVDPGNPVALARIHEHFARLDRRRNPAQDPAGRRQQDANVRQAHADTQRARQQDRFDTIEFEASIGKVTRQQEISQLQTLLKTIHNNRALRRQIRQQIYQLRHAQDDTSLYDLNLGNIKLPTVYEIRRAMKGGAGPTRHQVQLQQNNRLNITVANGADVDEVFAAIDGYTGSGLQAAGKAAGVF